VAVEEELKGAGKETAERAADNSRGGRTAVTADLTTVLRRAKWEGKKGGGESGQLEDDSRSRTLKAPNGPFYMRYFGAKGEGREDT